MLTVLLGLAAGLGYGLADFVGGLASRRVHYSVVSVVGTATAVVITFAALLVLPGTPTAQALTWGTIAGLGGGFGGLMLYRGLGRGRMGVVAPLSALGTAVIPVIVGVALGERPSIPAWAGIALALPAIWLVSTSSEPALAASAEAPAGGRRGLEPGVIEGLLAGLGFALLLIGLGLGGDGVGLWPVAVSQVTALVVMGAAMLGALRRPENRNVPRREAGLAVLGGPVRRCRGDRLPARDADRAALGRRGHHVALPGVDGAPLNGRPPRTDPPAAAHRARPRRRGGRADRPGVALEGRSDDRDRLAGLEDADAAVDLSEDPA